MRPEPVEGPSTSSGNIVNPRPVLRRQGKGAMRPEPVEGPSTSSGHIVNPRRPAALKKAQRVFSSTLSNSFAMRFAISKEAVAAGDGAFSTCTWRGARR